MNRFLPGLVLLLFAGCGDVPPVEIGDGGVRLLDGEARDLADAYEQAYASLRPNHHRVRINLDPLHRNPVGARAAMERIVESLQTMQSASKPTARPKFDPYVDKYRAWLLDLERDRWGGSFLLELDRTEREVKSLFDPATAEIAAAPPAPKEASRPPADAATFRVLTTSWETAHAALAKAVAEGGDAARPYEDVVATLKLMKGQLSGSRADLVQYQLDWYADLHTRSQGFKSIPGNAKEFGEELEVPARVLRKEFKPGK